jgi:hypothetical protein
MGEFKLEDKAPVIRVETAWLLTNVPISPKSQYEVW